MRTGPFFLCSSSSFPIEPIPRPGWLSRQENLHVLSIVKHNLEPAKFYFSNPQIYWEFGIEKKNTPNTIHKSKWKANAFS